MVDADSKCEQEAEKNRPIAALLTYFCLKYLGWGGHFHKT